jgi:hypothetical protein
VVALLLTAFILANSSLYELLFNYVNELILSKPTSDSGVERASWNALALQNFFDTWGLGAGLGTNRSSSFPLALLSKRRRSRRGVLPAVHPVGLRHQPWPALHLRP